jgi:regulation of enolase protein 1 (concanavalin A-like superfamily)
VDIHESFARPTLHPALRWHREPPRWTVRLAERCLRVEPAAATDFWQKTHDGLEADNGHFLFAEVTGDFVLSTRVRFQPVHQYDQAGLMVRVSAACWLKTSVEYELTGASRLGAVVTNHGYSDWSTQSVPAEDRPRAAVGAGLYACSPKGAGFVAEFTYLNIDHGRLARE